MALGVTPTIVICLTAGVAAGVALARPDDEASTADSRYESTASTVVGSAAGASDADPPDADPAPGYGGVAPSADTIPDDGGIGDGDTGPGATPPGATISIEEFAFDGQTAVAPGTAIEVTNLDGTAHTLTARDGSFNTGQLDGDAVATIVAPDAPGEYEFFCTIHPSMQGVLTVG